MSKKKKIIVKNSNSNQNLFIKIKEFFFPKEGFRHELRKGLYLGSHSKLAPNTETGNPGVLFYLPYLVGKSIRKIVDPNKKMFKKDDNQNDNTSNKSKNVK